MSAIDIGELRALLTLQDNFSGPINGAAKQLGVFGESFGAVTKFAGLAVAGIAAAGAAVIALGTHGADVADVRDAFGNLTARAGETADVMLGALREGTLGTISDFELMQAANKALGSGLVKNADDMRTLAAGAKMMADRVGGNTKDAFDNLTSAMASGRTAGLKQMGLFVDSKAAVDNFAASIGKSSSDLTGAEKAQALAAGTLAKLREEMEATGAPAADFGDRMAQMKVRVQNFVDGLSVGIAKSPVLAAGLKSAGDAMDKAFGAKQEGAISGVVGLIQKAAIFVMDLASVGITAADFLTRGFYGVRAVLNIVLEAFAEGLSKAMLFFAGLTDAASKLPVIGSTMKTLADGLRDGARTASFMAAGFGELKDKALDSADSSMKGYAKVKGVIDAARDAMVKASGAQEGATEAVKRHGAATAEVATTAAADLAKIAAAHQKLEDDISLIGTVGIERRLLENEIARQRELGKLSEFKGLSVGEYEDMANLINEKYSKMAAGAKLGADQIRDTTQKLLEDIALSRTTGLEQELMQIEFARQAQIDSLANLAGAYTAQYGFLLALVNAKYAAMAAAAQGHGLTVEQMASKAGFKSREELQRTADTAAETYEKMVASGKYGEKELQEASEKAEEAKRAAKGQTAKYSMTADQALLTGAQQVLSVLGEKNKTAAIAGAIIATYQAVAKALASAPWPFNLALAAGALAAGMANVSKIKSAKSGGYADGTPGTHFLDFGRGTSTTLHGQEAVVTKSQGESLAGMLMDAVEGGGGRAEAIHVHVHIDGREAAQAIVPHMPRMLALNGVG